ncbi:MAG: hypothetical protein ACR2MX_06335 [Cyclobacteriaceae bacterium]
MMTAWVIVTIYIASHIAVTVVRAYRRAQKYQYYYVEKGIAHVAFPRSFKKRVFNRYTVLSALLFTGFGYVVWLAFNFSF